MMLRTPQMHGLGSATELDVNGNVVSGSLCQPVAANPWYCAFWWTQACHCLPVGNITPGLPAGYDSSTGLVDPNNVAGSTEDAGTTGIGIPTTPPYPLSSALLSAGMTINNFASTPWVWLAVGLGIVLFAQRKGR